mmetsp:Transcript_21954/g.45143  ORF Transcript_21954/g.45143 Transcript_21954/m.45143 type:complete len:201 (-) Transcript_21954:137-739(-)
MDPNHQLRNHERRQVRRNPLNCRKLPHWPFQKHDHAGVGEKRSDSTKPEFIAFLSIWTNTVLFIEHRDPTEFMVESRYNKGQEHGRLFVLKAHGCRLKYSSLEKFVNHTVPPFRPELCRSLAFCKRGIEQPFCNRSFRICSKCAQLEQIIESQIKEQCHQVRIAEMTWREEVWSDAETRKADSVSFEGLVIVVDHHRQEE